MSRISLHNVLTRVLFCFITSYTERLGIRQRLSEKQKARESQGESGDSIEMDDIHVVWSEVLICTGLGNGASQHVHSLDCCTTFRM